MILRISITKIDQQHGAAINSFIAIIVVPNYLTACIGGV